ncbi:UDP-N-acetylglucosamine pyrophosphorylase [uncultured Clostridium sp.]|uniref:UDP-N-acetylglucosamine pyrophosphorylase n=1 Tax=uncultured Clostridium sp. TaxID=59620 RepID=UPI00263323FB|nr:UDP-N-acetylglucosamine pyrophosphorylase [uncultured Clostridium sp.]
MELNLTTYKLGKLLKDITENYESTLMTKIKLSGGFMTMFGDVSIEKIPQNALTFTKGNNIIDIKVKTGAEEGAILKITGMKNGFNVTVAETRYREICKGKFSEEIKINPNECKVRIDEDMIFTVKASLEDIKKFI